MAPRRGRLTRAEAARRAREARRPPSVGQDSEDSGHTPHGPHPRPRVEGQQEQQQQRNESQERDLRELAQLRLELDEVFGRATRAQRADYLTLMRDLNRDVARRINGGEPPFIIPTLKTPTLRPTCRYLPPGLHIWPYWLYSTSHWHTSLAHLPYSSSYWHTRPIHNLNYP